MIWPVGRAPHVARRTPLAVETQHLYGLGDPVALPDHVKTVRSWDNDLFCVAARPPDLDCGLGLFTKPEMESPVVRRVEARLACDGLCLSPPPVPDGDRRTDGTAV